jgi:dsRNA-specific ribonuclease
MPLVGQPKPQAGANPAAQTQVEKSTAYIAQVYVNRRKVYETTGASEDEAYQKAKQQKQQYESRGLNAVIVVRKSP